MKLLSTPLWLSFLLLGEPFLLPPVVAAKFHPGQNRDDVLGEAAHYPRFLGTTTTRPVRLNFDALPHLRKVGHFYDGKDGGPNDGIVFGPGAYAINEVLNQDFAFTNEPSPNNTLYLLDGAGDAITVRTGFTGLSFAYSQAFGGDVTIFDGPNGTGFVVANGTLQGGGIDLNHHVYAYWFNFTLNLPPGVVATSVLFSGTLGYIDDMEFQVVVPPPPTDVPTKPPSKAPAAVVDPCAGVKTTYWVYNATNNAPIRRLVNRSTPCLVHPYNIQARPCALPPPSALPVTMKLVRVLKDGRRKVVHSRDDNAAPFYLFGDSKATGDVLPSPGRLSNGKYRLTSTLPGDGKVVEFTQSCYCPKGKKGCRN